MISAGIATASASTYPSFLKNLSVLEPASNWLIDIPALAQAFRASFVVWADGTVIFTRNQTYQNTESQASSILFSRNGKISSSNPALSKELREALQISSQHRLQCINTNSLESLVTLRTWHVGNQDLTFIRQAKFFSPNSADITTLGKSFSLTKSECQILEALVNGMSPEQIGRHFSIALTTVRTHIRNLLAKTASEDIRRLVISVTHAIF
jgi:DNA-binding CsgD family transcriptional regulator